MKRFTLYLYSVNDTGRGVGAPIMRTNNFTINDNEITNGPNPVDGMPFFVHQQRPICLQHAEPDPAGDAVWQ